MGADQGGIVGGGDGMAAGGGEGVKVQQPAAHEGTGLSEPG